MKISMNHFVQLFIKRMVISSQFIYYVRINNRVGSPFRFPQTTQSASFVRAAKTRKTFLGVKHEIVRRVERTQSQKPLDLFDFVERFLHQLFAAHEMKPVRGEILKPAL